MIYQRREELKVKLYITIKIDSTTLESLKEYFTNFGEIEGVKVVKKPGTDISGCFGFVVYKSHFSVNCVLHSKPYELDGRTLDVIKCLPKPTQKKIKRVKLLINSTTDTREAAFVFFEDDRNVDKAAANHSVEINFKVVPAEKIITRTPRERTHTEGGNVEGNRGDGETRTPRERTHTEGGNVEGNRGDGEHEEALNLPEVPNSADIPIHIQRDLQFNCGICNNTAVRGRQTKKLPCLCEFHEYCVENYLKRKTSCPNCKKIHKGTNAQNNFNQN